MTNAVFGKTLGSDIPQDHGLNALKYLFTHNSIAFVLLIYPRLLPSPLPLIIIITCQFEEDNVIVEMSQDLTKHNCTINTNAKHNVLSDVNVRECLSLPCDRYTVVLEQLY